MSVFTNEPNKNIKKSFLLKLEEHFSKRRYKILLNIIVIGFFILIITAPIINIISNVIDNVGDIRMRLFHDELLGNSQWQMMRSALLESFLVAFIAVFIDLLIAFPIAMILTRGNFIGRKILDFLVDLPMVVPTSALGFSVLLFWGVFNIYPGRMLIIFVHVAFTYPYIVRNLKIAIEKVDPLLEKAALTLKASRWTVFKTITFPLIREGLIAGGILAFTRSLGETGATMICAGLVETAPIVVVALRKQLQLPAASFLSLLLITISLILLIIVKLIARRKKSTKKFWTIHYEWEKFISKPSFRYGLKILSFISMAVLILIPSFYIISQVTVQETLSELLGADNKWAYLWISLVNSFKVGFIVVLIDVIFAIPFALILVRENWGKFNAVLDTILDVPLTIPSAALGFAVFMFWGPAGINFADPGIGMIIFTHLTFSFPFVVRPIVAQLRNVNKGHEEASATLGSSPITTFRRITFPAILNGIIAGMIAAFTRSLGETGATLIVMGADRTVPVLIVDWVEQSAFSSAAFASTMVIIISAFLLALIRFFEPEQKDIF
ncbi:MAG: ABC transporter permease subunit [Candidatus Lokiarchaeota archaeon]|nr:ABC transporter permease subunit [Candidatus Lokiarchaeota archaeon]